MPHGKHMVWSHMTCMCIINQLNFLQVFRFFHVTYTQRGNFKCIFNIRLMDWQCLLTQLGVNSIKTRVFKSSIQDLKNIRSSVAT